MKVKILILALSIVTLAGCGNDESPLGVTTGNSGPTALHVNGNICVTIACKRHPMGTERPYRNIYARRRNSGTKQ